MQFSKEETDQAGCAIGLQWLYGWVWKEINCEQQPRFSLSADAQPDAAPYLFYCPLAQDNHHPSEPHNIFVPIFVNLTLKIFAIVNPALDWSQLP